mmetsp:Transcript_9451/g.18191  ORF Transcript_9451/g.18191 Transcript_9451/m.18191 type:complete len:701 (+) Transcript_9451:782-2884(+)|eukprot:CAMPEP_0204913336 /NCGR_PEP_ID=MMETSP1397-20131031/11244_1 /ASSEMBLY_ACC=CAM_ASM_000891 /TAXON_ID=49980 /ORGANISM="Climacostomum Climacostomum virens, Strain Stock W-24" /LENGTH=700 /DNA_ID=CAMNT_0052084549 /DNA_START=756 /DNA_END=2861 /DNA_ORIENTATION=+
MSYLLNWVSDDSNETAEFSCVHSEDEINRVTLPESMNAVERALHILENGLPVQKQAVFEKLEFFIKEDRGLRVFTAAVRMLPLAQESLQVTAAKSFQRLIDTFPSNLNETLLELTVQILSVWSSPVHEAWRPVFTKLVGKVKKEVLNTTIVRDIMKLGDVNQAKTYRTAACTMTPALAPFVAEIYSRQLIKKSFDLSQDIEYTIRLRMAKELEQLFDIGQTFVQTEMWQEIINLLEDDNSDVQKEALSLLMKSLKHLSFSFRREQAIPIVLKAISGPFATDVILPKSGECLQTCCRDLEAMRKLTDFMDFFRTQLISSDPDTALAATRNLPGILLVLGNTRNDYDNLLLGAVRSSHIECKKVIAAALADIASAYANRSELLQIIIEELLEDTAAQTIILSKLPALIVQAGIDSTKVYNKMLGLLRHSNWRVLINCLVTVQSLMQDINQPYLKDTLPELLFGIMKEGAVPARNKASEVIAQLISILVYSDFRREIIESLSQDLAKSPRHLDRQTYLDFCYHAIKCFSRRFFKEHFFDTMLTLSRDNVTSVRTKFAKMIPSFRMGLSTETSLILSEVVNMLSRDSAKVVSEAACDANAFMLKPDFWKNLDSEALLKADQLKEETEGQMLIEEQRNLDEIKKKFVDQLATRAKQEYKASKQKNKLNPRVSMKVTASPQMKTVGVKRSSMIDIRRDSVSKPPKK